MSVIQFTQVVDKHTLKEIVKLKTPANMWDRLKRIFTEQASEDEPLQVWIDLLDDDGQDILGDPIRIMASKAVWLLRDFFSRPKTEWGKIQQY